MSTQRYDFRSFLARSVEIAFDESELAKVVARLPSIGPEGPWLAGGALRRTLMGKPPESDFDFFFRDAEQFAEFERSLIAWDFAKLRETEHHAHYRGEREGKMRDIQLIRFRYYTNASEVVESFDFTICQFAFDGVTLTAGEHALWDLGRKRLAINRVTFPVSTMRRLLKYGRQGFTACNGCLTTILTETVNTPELQTQLHIAYVD